MAERKTKQSQSKRPRKKSGQASRKSPLRKFLSMLWAIFLFALSFLGIGAIWDFYETEPQISASSVTDPAFPLKLPFYVSNPGHMFTLHDVACMCRLIAPAVPPVANVNMPWRHIVVMDAIAQKAHGKVFDVPPQTKHDFDCGYEVTASLPVLEKWPVNTTLDIQASYSVRMFWWELHETSGIISFYTYSDSSGVTHWIAGTPHFEPN